ncbi:ABC transporter substrate-binding protein [Rhizobium vallis]|uniref:ABC transporter substrate-binding protein n=1 Tax=Rhizobium vallis TaxID=634290 RepID=UPI0024783EE6|nr:ABC transporter substrate-binding protein [Rhizobium vallis]
MTTRSTTYIRRAGAAFAGLLLAQTMLSGLAHAEDRAALMAQHRGGTMTLSAVSAAGTIDPMINYTAQYWQVYQMTYDGLVKFKQAGGTEGFKIVPAIAEAMPEIKNDGKTYVFKIRKGVMFSNGKEVTRPTCWPRSSGSSGSRARPWAASTMASSAPINAWRTATPARLTGV